MPIPFPKMHIAQSVLNRVMNTLEDESMNQPLQLQAPPITPDPTVLGAEIDKAVETPPAPAEVKPEMETDANNGMLEASVLGGSPFDGALVS